MGKFSALHQHFLKYVHVLIEALQYYAARDCDHYIGMLTVVVNYVTNFFSQLFEQLRLPILRLGLTD